MMVTRPRTLSHWHAVLFRCHRSKHLELGHLVFGVFDVVYVDVASGLSPKDVESKLEA